MTPTIAPEHDDQKNYPLFNRLGTAQRIDEHPCVCVLYLLKEKR